MKFLISGATSIFAKKVGSLLETMGHEVTMIGRNTEPSFNLETAYEIKSTLQSFDVFLHFAHSFNEEIGNDVNVSAAKYLVDVTQEIPSIKSFYVSSDSASPIAKSNYGISKYAVERVFLNSQRWKITRVGIILDCDVPSPYLKLKKLVKCSKILVFPLVHKKRYTTTTCLEFVDDCLASLRSDGLVSQFAYLHARPKLSILEVLAKEGIHPKLVIPAPPIVIRVCSRFLGVIPGLARISDSLLSSISEFDADTKSF
jgi:hypothetical protein